ncbi:DUF5130 family protein [Pseudonocardia sp. KRD-184]|uniref:DUF5130 family protein n=1 Tax=Pseudonocardia oceani TaxID=2792013 RepID=A0ABS6U5D2_9PSEU|nr:DUF5130 family protein [Pseudonocardia oceani]MBW0091364.1 DUF5130 family protein [Pseudonocardia oceani]MBW0098272.1 DUF5130 family protein [Pseudonocardia oceani]MBW0110948.1 DUF5130 family protein [Pseudonocardia oceani]MBW0124840.1 DUF5130 family protein [Pseudonocardia oceani]MBW0127442.1 DUF5130 family protein [Pseudonocardia oceani]
MAAGEGHGHGRVAVPEDLPPGTVVTSSGRVSAAEVFAEPDRDAQPFTPVQLTRLDEALTLASRETGLRFSVYLGDLGPEVTARVAELHSQLEGSGEAVLVAVSPEQRVVEVLTGAEARVRLPDRGAKLAVMSMVASFREGDLLGGLLSGLRMLADQAGGRRRTH